MKISLARLNTHVEPPLTAEAAEDLLTRAGLPIESIEAVQPPSGPLDQCLDVEVNSNRGDVLCHAAMAREIVAVSAFTAAPRTLVSAAERTRRLHALGGAVREPAASIPASPSNPDPAADTGTFTLRSEAGPACPRFLLRRIRNVRVGPSPAWLVNALAATGQRSINTIVDATNFILTEIGNPSHAFDAATFARAGRGPVPCIVRPARPGEKLTLLDGKAIPLTPADIVIADDARPLSLAGVMGGQDSGVSARTRDVLLEMATWLPVNVRATSRRFNLTSDAAYRYQRGVSPETLPAALDALTALVLAVAGGEVSGDTLSAGTHADTPPRTITLRAHRVRAVTGLGADLTSAEITRALTLQGFTVQPQAHAAAGGETSFQVAIPWDRRDITAEIDLIEEVARTIGYERIPAPEVIRVRIGPPQTAERAAAEITRILTGAGYFEAVTFSFTSAKLAHPFLAPGRTTLGVSDDRRGAEGILRPSILAGLLACRRVNQDRRVAPAGSVRLFEIASTFAQQGARDLQPRTLALAADLPASGTPAERRQSAVRAVTGVLEALAIAMTGSAETLTLTPAAPAIAAFDPAAFATVSLAGRPLGSLGILSADTQRLFELEHPVVAAELDLDALTAEFPPRARVAALPTMAATDRDLSLILPEAVTWSAVKSATMAANLPHLEALDFVTTYRGKPIPPGKKSLTLRMRFRHQDKTLRDQDVNPQVDALTAALKQNLGAEVRTA
ncbi:phenylalanine--tRNA ligase subunit beta [soil metagenome]